MLSAYLLSRQVNEKSTEKESIPNSPKSNLSSTVSTYLLHVSTAQIPSVFSEITPRQAGTLNIDSIFEDSSFNNPT